MKKTVDLASFYIPREFRVAFDVTITPAQAKFILEHHNPKNRPIKDTAVDGYSREMIIKKWACGTGEYIIFDWNAMLCNGQHRLLAVVKACIPVAFDIQFGIDPDKFKNLDTGVARRVGDQITLATGDKKAAYHAATVNAIKKIVAPRRDKGTVSFTMMMMEDFSRGLKVVADAIPAKNLFGRSPARGAFALAAEASPVKVREVLVRVLNGRATNPAEQALCAYGLSGFRMDREDDIAAKVLYGIYSSLTGKEIVNLTVKNHDENVSYFVDLIRRNHKLESVDVLKPA